jgi:hypothetical protein
MFFFTDIENAYSFIFLDLKKNSLIGLVHDGYRFGQVARSVFDRFQNRNFLPRFYASYYLGAYSYKHPVSEWICQIKYAHLVGIETGDIEFSTVRFMCL